MPVMLCYANISHMMLTPVQVASHDQKGYVVSQFGHLDLTNVVVPLHHMTKNVMLHLMLIIVMKVGL